MSKFLAVLSAGVMTVVGATGAHSGPLLEGFFQVLEEAGVRNISVESVSESLEGALVLNNLTAEEDGVRFQIRQVLANNASVSNDGFAAEHLVVQGMTRMSEDFVIGFNKLNLSNVSLPYSVSDQELALSTAIMTNGVVMDSTMNAMSIDRMVLSHGNDGGGFDISYQGKTSGQILSALFPWTLSSIEADLVPFDGTASVTSKSEDEAELALSLNLEGYGSYRLNALLTDTAGELTLARVLAGLNEVVIESAELELAEMAWLAEALGNHSEEERSQFTVFLSKIFGGIVASFGTFNDGLLVERSVVDFLNAPSGISIQVVPSRSFKDIIGSERKTLNFNISRRT